MIPSFLKHHVAWRTTALLAAALVASCGPSSGPTPPKAQSAASSAAAPASAAPGDTPPPAASLAAPDVKTPGCLSSGDGYLRAKLGGAVEAQLDWPNSGTQCQGESRGSPPGVRLSFRRDQAHPDLLLVFGLTGVQRGQPAREVGVNVTVIVQGTSQVYGTLGDSRCTVDRLVQRPLPTDGAYRIEARGFCTQPAHAVHGSGDVLVSTFEFAGPVMFVGDDSEQI
jgi:hypothetical protein